MIPNAFYTVLYQYDRAAKRWGARFTSNEAENLMAIYPLKDSSVKIEGENVVCSSEEDLGLAFLQFVDIVLSNRKAAEQGSRAVPTATEVLNGTDPQSPTSE